MAGQIIDNTWIPEIPIIIGVDWGGSNGHTWTADQDISAVTFTCIFKRGEKTIVSATCTNSGTYGLLIKIPKATTATLTPGAVRADVLGTAGGVTTLYGSIETVIRK